MRVNVERLPGSTVTLEIHADEEEFGKAMTKAYRTVSNEITIPGFRKGKAPKHIIDRMVGRAVVAEEAGHSMLDDLFKRAIAQENITPVGEPKAEILQLEPVGFKVTVEVFPTVTLGDYTAVRVEPREVEIEEGEVQAVLEQLQRTNSTWEEPAEPRNPREGDQVVLDITVYDGDELFQEPAQDATFVLGEDGLFESIQEAIKMMSVGTTADLTLAFEEDDVSVSPELRGKTLRYEFALKGVNERHLPDLDDELAKQAGEYETLEQLTEQLEKDLLRNKASEARGEVVTEIVDAMAESAEVDVPSTMIEQEVTDEITQLRSRLAAQRIVLEDYLIATNKTEEELREEMREDARVNVRRSLVLQELAKAENIEAGDEAIAAEIDRLVGPSENPERVRSLYESDYFRNMLAGQLFDRLLTERLIEIATEGRGAVIGAGAEALKQAMEPPTRRAAASDDEGADTDAGAADEDMTGIAAEDTVDMAANGELDDDAEAVVEGGIVSEPDSVPDTETEEQLGAVAEDDVVPTPAAAATTDAAETENEPA